MKDRRHWVVLMLMLIVGFVRVGGVVTDPVRPPAPFSMFEPRPNVIVGTATGTGFVIYSNDQFALILTNEHVIERAPEVTVGSFPHDRRVTPVTISVGGSEYEAEAWARLPNSDVALLICIGLAGIPALPLGNSDSLDIGDKVYALGCPGGICNTVTEGRVANTNVTTQTDGGRELKGMIMMDSTIDHGSSGGPLVNARGEVVGINTAVSPSSRFGFAIPIAQALRVLGEVPHAFREFFSEAAQELLSEAGRTTSARPEITAREARDRISPSTLFVDAPAAVDLTHLLPGKIDGYVMESRWWCKKADSPFGCHDVSESDIGLARGVWVGGSYKIKVEAIGFSNESNASLGSGRIREKEDRDFAAHFGYRQVSNGVLTFGDLRIPWSVLCDTSQWADGHPHLDPVVVPRKARSSAYLRIAVQFMLLGKIIVHVELTWRQEHIVEGTTELARAGEYTWGSGCLTYRAYQSTRSSTVICLTEFMAEFERVFTVVARAAFDGLP